MLSAQVQLTKLIARCLTLSGATVISVDWCDVTTATSLLANYTRRPATCVCGPVTMILLQAELHLCILHDDADLMQTRFSCLHAGNAPLPSAHCCLSNSHNTASVPPHNSGDKFIAAHSISADTQQAHHVPRYACPSMQILSMFQSAARREVSSARLCCSDA